MELIDYITDLLVDFDEMGFAPTTLCPNPEAYAIEWRNKITKAFKELTEENKAWQKQVISQKENAEKAYYDLACEVEKLRSENELLIASRHIPKSNDTVYVKINLPNRKDGSTYCLPSQRKIVSDTVRKMQERLLEEFKDWLGIPYIIDQIAKEILEEDQCQT